MAMMMRRKIGKTEKEVQAIGLGAMPLSIQGRPAEEEAKAVLSAALDAGTDFIDTADAYCLDETDMGHNEKLISDVLKKRGDLHRVIVATKGGCTRPRGDWDVDGRPERLKESCEKSLENLCTESIFLYQLHAPDPKVPFEDSVGAFSDLKKEGKILHVGLSNVTPEQLLKAQQIVRIETVQNRCHPLFKTDFENGLIDLCKRLEVTYIPYSPVGGHFGHLKLITHPLLQKLSKKYNATPYCVILSWHLSKGDHILPIPGAKKVSSAKDSPKAIDLRLDPHDIEQIDQIGGQMEGYDA